MAQRLEKFIFNCVCVCVSLGGGGSRGGCLVAAVWDN